MLRGGWEEHNACQLSTFTFVNCFRRLRHIGFTRLTHRHGEWFCRKLQERWQQAFEVYLLLFLCKSESGERTRAQQCLARLANMKVSARDWAVGISECNYTAVRTTGKLSLLRLPWGPRHRQTPQTLQPPPPPTTNKQPPPTKTLHHAAGPECSLDPQLSRGATHSLPALPLSAEILSLTSAPTIPLFIISLMCWYVPEYLSCT